MIDSLAPSGYMRYAPDGHFIFASFASAFLLKLLKPEFSSFLLKEQENEIFELIGRLIHTLSSPKIAIDDRHTPKLYARFLASLLSRHRRDGAGTGRLQTNLPPQNQPSSGTPQGTSGYMPSAGPSTQSSQSGQQNTGQGTHNVTQAVNTTTLPQAPLADGTTTFMLGDIDIMMDGIGDISEAEMLATMQAITSPSWWSNVMMPGYVIVFFTDEWPLLTSRVASRGRRVRLLHLLTCHQLCPM